MMYENNDFSSISFALTYYYVALKFFLILLSISLMYQRWRCEEPS
ncbi:unnamed protein product [Enterobius vermicularis]|uniref:Uncharacterized protein n=1 Tax=Enterobius vermicularis TaxID=51028 RepID=A0A0N4VJX3_ENTVE|nr:unnamed protein product [Enterobius vermicularis]